MSFLEGLGTLIGTMSKPHTSDYVVIDQYKRAYKVDALSPEDAALKVERTDKRIKVRGVRKA
jgi:hypothetical protein